MSGSRGWQASLAGRGGERLDVAGEVADVFEQRAREADERDAEVEREIARRDARQPIDRLLGR